MSTEHTPLISEPHRRKYISLKSWFKKPREGWAYVIMFITALSVAVIIASQIQLNTYLVCRDILGTTALETENWETVCRKTPGVQRGSASLARNNTLAMGICMTMVTAYLGALSDRIGRTKLLALTALGGTAHSFGLYLLLNSEYLVKHYRATMMVCYALHGITGGLGVMWALCRAYISDTSPVDSRAKSLSRASAFIFIGLFVGPTIGSFLIKYYDHGLRPAFMASILLNVLLVFLSLFVVPESLSQSVRKDALRSYGEKSEARKNHIMDRLGGRIQSPLLVHLALFFLSIEQSIYEFIEPIKILYPVRRSEAKEYDRANFSCLYGPVSDEYYKKTGRQWNLLLLALADTLYSMYMSMISYELLYTTYRFDWDSHDIGLYLSLTSFIKSMLLLVFFPVLLRKLHKRQPQGIIEPAIEEDLVAVDGRYVPTSNVMGTSATPSNIDLVRNSEISNIGKSDFSIKNLDDFAVNPILESVSQTQMSRHDYKDVLAQVNQFNKVRHDANIDLWISRLSITTFILGEVLQGLNGGRVYLYLFAMAIRQTSAIASPTIQSVVLAFAAKSDSGRLSGAISLMDSIASTLMGPVVFSYIYMASADTIPEMIFFVSAAFGILSLMCQYFARIPQQSRVYAP